MNPNLKSMNKRALPALAAGLLSIVMSMGACAKGSGGSAPGAAGDDGSDGGNGGGAGPGAGGNAGGSSGTGTAGTGGASSAGAAGASGGAGGRGGAGGVPSTGGTGGGGGAAGATGGAGGAGGAGGMVVPPAPLPGLACTDASPWTTTGTPAYRLVVDAAQRGQAWNRFYEKMVAADHANTILTTAWGRNIQGALKKGHDQAGFGYVRFHGLLNDDIGVYSEPGGVPTYTWTRLDQVYDAIVAAGMRPFVEIGFMPQALASDATKIQTLLWYNNRSPNISPPKDVTRWQDFMAALVQHLEQRYGVSEVRNNWYFEVWNESSWMYSLGLPGYNALYGMTVQGLLRGDPMIKVGGPAESQGGSAFAVGSLIQYARTNNLKLDFVSYHTYGQTDTSLALANPATAGSSVAFHATIANTTRTNTFTGTTFVTEWGPSYTSPVARDSEVSASYVAKTVHLLGTSATVAPPDGAGYWTISDLYEEVDTGTNLAYREGNYGLMLKGDSRFPESFDVPKPAFNAFRLLHLMGDVRLSATGGTTADGVNVGATVRTDNSRLEILVYNHTDGGAANSATPSLVNLTVNNLPFGAGPVQVRHYIVDRTHASSYLTWTQQGRPAQPTQAQWVALRNAAELCYYGATVTPTGNSWTVSFPQNNYSVSLIVLSR